VGGNTKVSEKERYVNRGRKFNEKLIALATNNTYLFGFRNTKSEVTLKSQI